MLINRHSLKMTIPGTLGYIVILCIVPQYFLFNSVINYFKFHFCGTCFAYITYKLLFGSLTFFLKTHCYFFNYLFIIICKFNFIFNSRIISLQYCPRRLTCKSRKSRDTWKTGKFGLGVQNKAGPRLTEFCQENTLVIANNLFYQHKRRLYTWPSPEGQYQTQTDYILCSRRWRSSIQSGKKKKKTWSSLWLRS